MTLTRRSILKALPFVGASAMPAAASDLANWQADPESAPEHPWEKARRLAQELSETLAECQREDGDQGYAAIVEPDGSKFPVLFENMRHRYAPAEERRDRYLSLFKKACEEIDPNIRHWSLCRDEDRGTIVLMAFVRTGRYEGDGLYESGTESIWGRRGQWHVKLRSDKIDGQRSFTVTCDGEYQVLTEPRLETFIGRRIA